METSLSQSGVFLPWADMAQVIIARNSEDENEVKLKWKNNFYSISWFFQFWKQKTVFRFSQKKKIWFFIKKNVSKGWLICLNYCIFSMT